MDKLKAKLQSLSQDRRYMVFVGVAIVFNGMIAAAVPFIGILIGFLLGPFCILVGYYGGDVKKGLEEFKHDVMEAKDAAASAAEKSAEMAKDATEKAADGAKQVSAVAEGAAKKAEAGAKKAVAPVEKKPAAKKVPVKKVAEKK